MCVKEGVCDYKKCWIIGLDGTVSDISPKMPVNQMVRTHIHEKGHGAVYLLSLVNSKRIVFLFSGYKARSQSDRQTDGNELNDTSGTGKEGT